MPRSFSRPAPLTMRLAVAIGLMVLTVSLSTLVLAPSPTRAATHSVQIQDSTFGPVTLTVSVGDTVTWTNADDRPHTVTAGGGQFDSGNLDPGQTFSFTFTEPGTYAYVCSYHDEMSAGIVVESADPTAATAAPATAGGNSTGQVAGSEGQQPDTAVPLTDAGPPPLAIPLIGFGLVAIAVAVVPSARAVVRVVSTERPLGGWRR